MLINHAAGRDSMLLRCCLCRIPVTGLDWLSSPRCSAGESDKLTRPSLTLGLGPKREARVASEWHGPQSSSDHSCTSDSREEKEHLFRV